MAEADALLGAAAENVAGEPAKATNAPPDSGGVDAVAGVPPTSLAAGTADAATNADAADAAAAAAAAAPTAPTAPTADAHMADASDESSDDEDADAAAAAASLWSAAGAPSRASLSALLCGEGCTPLHCPQLDALRAELERLDWMEEASRLVAAAAAAEAEGPPLPPESLPTLPALRMAMERAVTLGLSHLDLAHALQKRVAAAAKWSQRANNALRRRSYLSVLESLGSDGAVVGVRLEQLEEIRSRISEARAWAVRARAALGRRSATPAEIRTLAGEAEVLNVTIPEEEEASLTQVTHESHTRVPHKNPTLLPVCSQFAHTARVSLIPFVTDVSYL